MGHEDSGRPHIAWTEFAWIGFVAAAILASGLRIVPTWRGFDIGGLAAVLAGGYPIFREALAHVLSRRMTMELSMTIALAAAVVIGQFFTALVILEFVLIAEVLEHLTVGQGRRAISDLLALLPQSAEARRAGGVSSVPISSLQPGDVVIVRPGGRVPVDGVVTAGHSFVDQSAITGESLPAEKAPRSEVFAGSVNQSGVLEVATERIGRDTTFGKVIEAVEHAESIRAPVQKTADRLAGYLVYFALACAGLTLAVTHNPISTISVIIVAGACGVAAGTPLAILGGIGRAARQGAVIKGGLYLEKLGQVDTVVFDKTGTLTLGNPEVVGCEPAAGADMNTLLRLAAAAERWWAIPNCSPRTASRCHGRPPAPRATARFWLPPEARSPAAF